MKLKNAIILLLSATLALSFTSCEDYGLPEDTILSYDKEPVIREYNDKISITLYGVTFNMIKVKAGTFTMGATSEQTGAYDSEKPAHQVTLTKDYYIGETEVTNLLWFAVMGNISGINYGLNVPAEEIDWDDCQKFITKLSQLTGLKFRLPTEAEWEYAARGGHKKPTQTLYSGSNTINDVAWYNKRSSSIDKYAVALKEANALGLYDMSGNVFEWCNDWYDYDYYSSSPQIDPTGPESGLHHVLRGGSHHSDDYECRVSYRTYGDSYGVLSYYGMRLALGEPLPEPEPEPEPEPDPNDKIITANGVTFKMKLVEAGTFTMGATSEQTGAWDDEKPAHQVTLTKDYYMGETEVTQALWYAVMGHKPTSDGDQWKSSYGLGDNYPAYYISWNDCQEFITKLNQLTGLTFRLPTEAEWEYAARGGNKATTQTLYSGSSTIGDVAWYRDNSSSSTQAVAGKKANALGLYDMSGNVWEWCNDYWYGSYSSGAQTDPTGPLSGSYRVLRSGGWSYSASSCRVANRNSNSVTYRNSIYGMRLALTAK